MQLALNFKLSLSKNLKNRHFYVHVPKNYCTLIKLTKHDLAKTTSCLALTIRRSGLYFFTLQQAAAGR